MSESFNQKVQSLVSNGYPFKMGEYISKGFNIFSKNPGGFIGFTLLYLLMSTVISLVPFIGSLVSSLVIGPALSAGFLLVACKLDRDEPTEFGDFFKGFQYLNQLIVLTLVMDLIVMGSLIPLGVVVYQTGIFGWYMDLMANPFDAGEMPHVPVWTLLLALPAMYLSIAYVFAIPNVIFQGLGFWEALEASRRIITKNWFLFLLFFIVLGLIVVAGVIALLIGMLIALPAIFCAQYAAYADIVGIPDGESEDIIDHLVE